MLSNKVATEVDSFGSYGDMKWRSVSKVLRRLQKMASHQLQTLEGEYVQNINKLSFLHALRNILK